MKLLTKIRWILSISLVFIIVLTTNLIDRENFNKLRYAVTTIYEDRVVSSDLIFEISIRIQEKETAFAVADTTFIRTKNDSVNDEIQELISRYEQTKLTEKEKRIFSNLKEELATLFALEKQYAVAKEKKAALFLSMDKAMHYLYGLSKIQIEEGQNQMKKGNRAIKAIDLFTQIEIIFLVVMAILVQIIILYNPKK